MKFTEFNFSAEIMDGLDAMGFETPSPVQELAIPKIIEDKDMIVCAQTGTGKTAAYLLPVMDKIQRNKLEGFSTLILVPTRELAIQIDQQMEGFGYFVSVTSLAVYGGGDSSVWEQQKRGLTEGADVVIATPGRMISHLNLGYVQNLMFSATMPPKIRQLAQEILVDAESINIAISKPAEGVLQAAYMVYDEQKVPLIKHLLEGKDMKSVIIFSATKSNVKTITKIVTFKFWLPPILLPAESTSTPLIW